MTTRRLAPLLGALLGLGALAGALLAARALSDLARGRLTLGLTLGVAALLLRLLLGVLPTSLREWRRREVSREWTPLLRSRFPRGHTLSGALEALDLVPDDVTVDLARASLATTLLGLPLIFVRSGWLPLLIVLALMGLSAPLYVRAGRAAEAADVEYRAKRRRLLDREVDLLGAGVELRGLGVGRVAVEEMGALSRSEHQVAEEALRVALRSSLVTEFLSGVSVGLVAMVVGFALMGGRTGLLSALVSVLVTAEIFLHVRRYGLLFHRREAVVRALDTLSPWRVAPTSSLDEHLRLHELRTRGSAAPVSLVAPPGSRVALLGPSGVGKTTLCHTVMGWITPEAGEVHPPAGPIAYVSVESRLPDGSLADLVGGDLSTAERRDLLARLGLSPALLEDLSRPVVIDGEGLSTGERVRVLLARALARRSVLILLDDVAGVLDEGSRALVRDVVSTTPAAVVEAAVDQATLIDATTEIRL